MSKFLHDANTNNNDNAKAIAILWVFSQNSQAKNLVGDCLQKDCTRSSPEF